MKIAIRVILFAAIAFITYQIYDSVMAPIRYAKEVKEKESKVIKKLKIIREAQLAYKEVNGGFTASFDTLIDFMNNGKIKMFVEYGDKDDSTTVFKREEVLVSVKDSFFRDVDIDNIRFVPYHDTLQFEMAANIIVKNNVKVPVFQVTDPDPFSRERQ